MSENSYGYIEISEEEEITGEEVSPPYINIDVDTESSEEAREFQESFGREEISAYSANDLLDIFIDYLDRFRNIEDDNNEILEDRFNRFTSHLNSCNDEEIYNFINLLDENRENMNISSELSNRFYENIVNKAKEIAKEKVDKRMIELFDISEEREKENQTDMKEKMDMIKEKNSNYSFQEPVIDEEEIREYGRQYLNLFYDHYCNNPNALIVYQNIIAPFCDKKESFGYHFDKSLDLSNCIYKLEKKTDSLNDDSCFYSDVSNSCKQVEPEVDLLYKPIEDVNNKNIEINNEKIKQLENEEKKQVELISILKDSNKMLEESNKAIKEAKEKMILEKLNNKLSPEQLEKIKGGPNSKLGLGDIEKIYKIHEELRKNINQNLTEIHQKTNELYDNGLKVDETLEENKEQIIESFKDVDLTDLKILKVIFEDGGFQGCFNNKINSCCFSQTIPELIDRAIEKKIELANDQNRSSGEEEEKISINLQELDKAISEASADYDEIDINRKSSNLERKKNSRNNDKNLFNLVLNDEDENYLDSFELMKN